MNILNIMFGKRFVTWQDYRRPILATATVVNYFGTKTPRILGNIL